MSYVITVTYLTVHSTDKKCSRVPLPRKIRENENPQRKVVGYIKIAIFFFADIATSFHQAATSHIISYSTIIASTTLLTKVSLMCVVCLSMHTRRPEEALISIHIIKNLHISLLHHLSSCLSPLLKLKQKHHHGSCLFVSQHQTEDTQQHGI
jgi:hypothetical protein